MPQRLFFFFFKFHSKLLYFTSPDGRHKDTTTLHLFRIGPVCLVQMGKSKLHLADLAAGFCSKTVTVCLISKGNGAFQMEVAISWDATISHHPGLPLLCRVSVATRGREKGKCQITIFMSLLPRECWRKKKKKINSTSIPFHGRLALAIFQTRMHKVIKAFPWRCAGRGGRVKGRCLQSSSPLCRFSTLLANISTFFLSYHPPFIAFFLYFFFLKQKYINYRETL